MTGSRLGVASGQRAGWRLRSTLGAVGPWGRGPGAFLEAAVQGKLEPGVLGIFSQHPGLSPAPESRVWEWGAAFMSHPLCLVWSAGISERGVCSSQPLNPVEKFPGLPPPQGPAPSCLGGKRQLWIPPPSFRLSLHRLDGLGMDG